MKKIVSAIIICAWCCASISYAANIGSCAAGNPDPPCTSQGKIITFYVLCGMPDCRYGMEGAIETNRAGLDGQKIPRSLDDVLDGNAKYVSLASCNENYGKYYALGDITFMSAKEYPLLKKRTATNVIGYVHDIGSAFKGRCDKIDVAVTICKQCYDKQASQIAGGRNVDYVPNGQGAYDPAQASQMFPGWSGQDLSRILNQTQSSSFGQPSPVSNQIQTTYPTIPGTQPPPPPPSSSTSSPQTFGQPVGMVFAQPRSPKSGQQIIVAWTSVHLSDVRPCQIFINDSQFLAQGNEGSRQAPAAPSAGPEKFTMKCVDQNGNSFEQSDTVIVQ